MTRRDGLALLAFGLAMGLGQMTMMVWPRAEDRAIVVFMTDAAHADAPLRLAGVGGRLLRVEPDRPVASVVFSEMPAPWSLWRSGILVALHAGASRGCAPLTPWGVDDV